MAEAKLITRLKADVSNHNQGFSQAQRALSNYTNSATSLDGVVKGAIGTLSKYVTASAAVTAALEVGKDAFFANEQNVDEWGRTVESAKGIYNGFLNALNTGDFSGFLSSIDSIVNAARAAYDALDELQTKSTIIAPSQAKAQAKINQQKEIIKKQGKDSDAGKAAQQEIKRLEVELKDGFRETAKLNRQAFISAVKAKAAESGVTLTNDMWRSFTDTKAYDRVKAGAKTNKVVTDSWKDTYGIQHQTTNDVDNNNMKFIKTFTDEFRKSVSGFLTSEWSAIGSAASSGISNAKYTSSSSGGGKSGSKSSKSTSTSKSKEVQLTSADILPDDIVEIDRFLRACADSWGASMAESLKGALSDGLSTLPDAVNEGLESVNDAFAESVKNAKNDIMVKQAQDTQVAWQGAASAMSSVGSALQNIEDPGAKVAGILAQAVASVMAGFATALASPVNSAGGVWSWIAASAAGLATAVATVAQIKSVGQFADGGVIGGNSYVGDKLFARVNSGETILNAAQSQRALDMMDAPGGRFGGGNSTISGEQIVTVINNYGRRTGRGEILR